MKKSVLALGIASALYGSVALADTTASVNGLVDLGVFSVKAIGSDTSVMKVESGGMTTSWFGVTGGEDIGGGLKVGYKLTMFLKADTGTAGRFTGDTLWSRDASISLSGAFGSAVIGRQIDPAFLPTILFNPFGDSFTVSPLVAHTYLGFFTSPSVGFYSSPLADSDSGWSNAISYSTPSMGGAVATVEYQATENAGGKGNSKPNVGANVLYFGGPLALAAYYQQDNLSNPTPALLSATIKTWSMNGSYDLKVAKLYASYGQSTKDDASSTKDKIAQFGVSIPAGGGSFLLDWANTKETGPGDMKWDTVSVGYDYNLSKRTDVYAAYMYDKVTDVSAGNMLGVGLRHRF